MRLHKIIRKRPVKNSYSNDISFIIGGESFEMFDQEFETLEQCLAYCDANDIPYEMQPAEWETVIFPTAKEKQHANI